MTPDPHAEVLARFRRYLEMEGGRSPRTAKECLLDASLFSRWFRERYGRPVCFEEVGSPQIRAFLASREVSPHRAGRLLASLRKLFRYLSEAEGLPILKDPTEGVKRPKLPRRLPIYLTPPEVARLLEAAYRHPSPRMGLRDWALFFSLRRPFHTEMARPRGQPQGPHTGWGEGGGILEGMTTEERLLKLEGMVEAVVRLLPERIASLENRLEAFRQELKGEIHALREEVRQEVASLRGEVGQQVTSLRGEMNTLRGEMAALRQEVKAEINTLFNRMMLVLTGLAVFLGLLTLLLR